MANTIQTQATLLLQQRATTNAATALGETETAISKAMELAIEQILDAVDQHAADNRTTLLQGYQSISGANYKLGVETLYGGTDAAGHSDWSSRTGTVLDQLFGNKIHGVLCHIEEQTGVKQSSATTLLGAAVPVVFGMINEHDFDQIGDRRFDKLSDRRFDKLSDKPLDNRIDRDLEQLNDQPLDKLRDQPVDNGSDRKLDQRNDLALQSEEENVAQRNFATDPLGTIADENILPVSPVDNTRVENVIPQSLYGVENETPEPDLVYNAEPAGRSNWLLYLLLATVLGLAIWWFTKG